MPTIEEQAKQLFKEVAENPATDIHEVFVDEPAAPDNVRQS